jgi:flagellar hook-associated protein 3 FlgL
MVGSIEGSVRPDVRSLNKICNQAMSHMQDLATQMGTHTKYNTASQLYDKGLMFKNASLMTSMKSTDQFKDYNSSLINKLNMKYSCINHIFDEVIKVQADLMQDSKINDLALQERVSEAISNISGILNTNIEGKYIFAGKTVDKRPIASPDALSSSNIVDGKLTSNYTDLKPSDSIKIGENTYLQDDVDASHEVFQYLVNTMNSVKNSHDDPSLQSEAKQQMKQLVDKISNLMAHVGAQSKQVTTQHNILSDSKVSISQQWECFFDANVTELINSIEQERITVEILLSFISKMINAPKITDYV